MSVSLKFKDVEGFKTYLLMNCGESQTEFAKRIGLDSSQMSGYMNGKSLMPPTARKIAKGVGLKLPDIFLPCVLPK